MVGAPPERRKHIDQCPSTSHLVLAGKGVDPGTMALRSPLRGRSERLHVCYTCAAPKAARSAETCAGHRGVGCLALAAAFSCICGTLVDTGVGGAVFCLRQGARHKRHRSGGAPSHPRMTVTVGVSVRVCVCVCVCV